MLPYCTSLVPKLDEKAAQPDQDVRKAILDPTRWGSRPPSEQSSADNQRVHLLAAASSQVTNQAMLNALSCRSLLESQITSLLDSGSMDSVQINIAAQVKDESIRAEIAKWGEYRAREDAARKVTDEKLLVDIILGNLKGDRQDNLTAAFEPATIITHQDALDLLERKLPDAEWDTAAKFVLKVVHFKRAFLAEQKTRCAPCRLWIDVKQSSELYGSTYNVHGAAMKVTVEAPGQPRFSRDFATVFPQRLPAGTSFITPQFDVDALLNAIVDWDHSGH
jgi:hypothetical protein